MCFSISCLKKVGTAAPKPYLGNISLTGVNALAKMMNRIVDEDHLEVSSVSGKAAMLIDVIMSNKMPWLDVLAVLQGVLYEMDKFAERFDPTTFSKLRVDLQTALMKCSYLSSKEVLVA